MNILKSIAGLFLLIISTTSCAGNTQPDSEILLNRMLQIDNNRYFTKTESGESTYNSLAEYRDWENLYIKYSHYDKKSKTLNEHEMKILLLIGFIARNNQDAAISESLSSDLVPLFRENTAVFLKTLSELNFLVPSSCYYLNRYFGFEGKNAEQKPAFVKHYSEEISRTLTPADAKQCLAFFKP